VPRTARICVKWLVTVGIVYWMTAGMFYALQALVGCVRLWKGGAEGLDISLSDGGRAAVAIVQYSDLLMSYAGLAALLAIIVLCLLEWRGRAIPAMAVCSWAAVVCLGIVLWLSAMVLLPLVDIFPHEVSQPQAQDQAPEP
jgi:hypothetical protein